MPVRSKSASLRASILSLLLPSFNKALRRGSQTSTRVTWGCSRSYSQAAQVPSSQVTCNSPRSPWMNCRMLLALVSTIDSITNLPLPLRAAITTASLCTSMPIYLISRLMQLPPWGKEHHAQRSLSLKVTCHSSADLPTCSFRSEVQHSADGPLSHNALTFKKAKQKRKLVLTGYNSYRSYAPTFRVMQKKSRP